MPLRRSVTDLELADDDLESADDDLESADDDEEETEDDDDDEEDDDNRRFWPHFPFVASELRSVDDVDFLFVPSSSISILFSTLRITSLI